MTVYKRPNIHMTTENYEKVVKYQISNNLSSFSEAIDWLLEIAFLQLIEKIPNSQETPANILDEINRINKYSWTPRKKLEVLFENVGDSITESDLQKIAQIFNRPYWWIRKSWIEIKKQYFNAS